MEIILGLLGLPLLLAIPAAWAWAQVKVLRRWHGAWRVAGALPLGAAAAWLAIFLRDVSADPTSHNLFPFEIGIGAVASLAYLGVLALLRWMVARF
ncbi:MAG: hypothetical protein U1E45_21940 [Geminicoccaceae bacterium]